MQIETALRFYFTPVRRLPSGNRRTKGANEGVSKEESSPIAGGGATGAPIAQTSMKQGGWDCKVAGSSMHENEAPREQSLDHAASCTSPFRTVFPRFLGAHKGHEGCHVLLCSSHYLLCSDHTGQLLTKTQQRNPLPKVLFKHAPLRGTGHTPFFLSALSLSCLSVSCRKVGRVRAA